MKNRHALLLSMLVAACGPDGASTTGARPLDVAATPPVAQAPTPGELHQEGALADGDVVLPTGALGDRFELAVARNDVVEVVVDSAEFDTYLQVVTPDGELLVNDDDPWAPTQSRLSFVARRDGELKITITSYAPGGRGRYHVDTTRRQAGEAELAAAGGQAQPQGDQPWSGDLLPNALRIASDLLSSRQHHRVELPPIAQPGGAAPPGGQQPGPAVTTIQLGAQVPGRLEPGDAALATGEYRDVYAFEGQAGTPVAVELQSSELDPYVVLVSPSGEQWENDDANGSDDAQLVMTLTETGTYRIVATSYRPGETGAYLLKVRAPGGGFTAAATSPNPSPSPSPAAGQAPWPATGPGTPSPQGPLSPGQPSAGVGASPFQSFNGSLDQADEHLSSGELLERHHVALQAGQPVQIRLASSQFDTYLIVRAPSGRQWDNDDFQQGSLDSGLDLVAPETGSYTLAVSSYRPGEMGQYTLTVATMSAGPATPGPATPAPGMPMPGMPMPGMPTPGAPAPGVPTPGVPGPGAIGIGQPVQGSLMPGDQQLGSGELMDAYPMEFQAGQQVRVAVESSQFDTYLIVRAPSGRQWDNDDAQSGVLNSALDLALTETGTYRVIVTSYRPGESGAYTLSVAPGAGAVPGQVPGVAMPGFPAPGLPGTPGQPGMPTQPTYPQPYPGQPAVPGLPGTPGQPATPATQPTQPGGGRIFGIYVGITDYPTGRLPLCADDAIKLADDMRRAGLQTPAQQVLLTDQDATPDRVRQAFAQMAQAVGPNDLFIFFYSGHGAQGEVQQAGQELDRREETINLVGGDLGDDEMAHLFDAINARVAIIALDSCFSGGFARDVISRPNRMGFFSSEEDLTSNVASSFQAGGYLSHFLRLGLRGEADTNPRDSLLTAGELSHYLFTMYATNMQGVTASTDDQQQGYQHLVIDRGSVRVSTPLVSYR